MRKEFILPAVCFMYSIFKLQAQDIDSPLSLPETANVQNRITLCGLPDIAITHAAAYEIRLLFKFSCRSRNRNKCYLSRISCKAVMDETL